MLNSTLARIYEAAAQHGWTMRADDTWPAFQLAPEGPATHVEREVRDDALSVLDALPAFRLRDASTGRPAAMIAYAPPRPAQREEDAVYGVDVLEHAKLAGLEAALVDRFDVFGQQAVVVAPPGTTLPTETEVEANGGADDGA